jgi:hypothetical protein
MNQLADDLFSAANSLSAIIHYEQKNIMKNAALEINNLQDKLDLIKNVIYFSDLSTLEDYISLIDKIKSKL